MNWCCLCDQPIIDEEPVPQRWVDRPDRPEPAHRECRDFFEESRPPFEERLRRYKEELDADKRNS